MFKEKPSRKYFVDLMERECKSSPDKKCHPPSGCYCSISALEPDDNCPTHGWNPLDRCDYCGRFLKRSNPDRESDRSE